MTSIEPTSVDRHGRMFLLARSKQFRKTIRIFTDANHSLDSPFGVDLSYFCDHDVLLCDETGYLFYQGVLIDIGEFSLYYSTYPVPDAWFDNETIMQAQGNPRCKVTGDKTVVFSCLSIPEDEWAALLGGKNID